MVLLAVFQQAFFEFPKAQVLQGPATPGNLNLASFQELQNSFVRPLRWPKMFHLINSLTECRICAANVENV